MIEIRPSTAAEIDEVARHHDVAPWIGGYSKALADMAGKLLFMTALDDGEVMGWFAFRAISSTTLEAHVAFLPAHRGSAIAAGTQMIHMLFNTTPCRKLVAVIPETNKRAMKYARRLGFLAEGYLTGAFEQGGELVDARLLSINKEA